MSLPLSIGLYVLAGLCEIGGGYLVWLWLCEGRPLGYAIAGAAMLILYGIIPTFQTAHFGRVYAAYGGMKDGSALTYRGRRSRSRRPCVSS